MKTHIPPVVTYPRRLYLFLLTWFVVALYPMRYLVIAKNPGASIYDRLFPLDLAELPIGLIVVFCVWLYSLALLIPRRAHLSPPPPSITAGVAALFYSLTAIAGVALIVSGTRMGNYAESTAERVVFGISFSILPLDFLFFTLCFLKRAEGKSILMPAISYIALSLLRASKAGIIVCCLIVISYRVLTRTLVFRLWYVAAALAVILCFPPLYILVAHMRAPDPEDFLPFFAERFDYMTESGNYFLLAIEMLSNRVNGLDVLSVPVVASELYSIQSYSIYYLKGLIPAFCVDLFANHTPYGLGRVFAIVNLGQAEHVQNAFETTLLGSLYFSNSPFLSFILLNVVVTGIILFFTKVTRLRRWYHILIFTYFLMTFCHVIMTGAFQYLTLSLRILLMFSLFFRLMSLLRRPPAPAQVATFAPSKI